YGLEEEREGEDCEVEDGSARAGRAQPRLRELVQKHESTESCSERDEDTGEQVVPKQDASQSAGEKWVERIEGGRRLFGPAVTVVCKAKEPDAVPTCPNIDEVAAFVRERGDIPAVGPRVSVRLEDEVGEHDRPPDRRSAPEKKGEDRANALTGRDDGPDHTSVAARRYFTLDEANEALTELRPLAEEMVERRRLLVQAQMLRAELGGQVAGNGGDLTPSDFAEAGAEVGQAAARPRRAREALQGAGGLVHDLGRGRLVFRSRRHG